MSEPAAASQPGAASTYCSFPAYRFARSAIMVYCHADDIVLTRSVSFPSVVFVYIQSHPVTKLVSRAPTLAC